MVSSCDRRIGDVPAASDMNPRSTRSSSWIRNYRFGCIGRAMNVGNQYRVPPNRTAPPQIPHPVFAAGIGSNYQLEITNYQFSIIFHLDRVKFRSPSIESGDWFAFLWRKTETGAREAQDHTGADFRLHQDRDPHASCAGRR